jgi:hypothetical protein
MTDHLIFLGVALIWIAIGILCGLEAKSQINDLQFRRLWSAPRHRIGLLIVCTLIGPMAVFINIHWLIKEVRE